MSPLLALLLAARGVTEPDAAAAFLGARLSDHLRSPLLFRQMSRAAARVVSALQQRQPIGIYGDYDLDGISGSAVLIRFLRAVGAEPFVHIPNRIRDGYGLSDAGVRSLAGKGSRVMITVDCGGVSYREIALAQSLGMDVIVCDHHQVAAEPLPAYAVLNPVEPDAGFPFSGLSGAGVAFYLALGVRMQLREAGFARVPDLRRLLDLVALGTIADVVPLVEENRVMVKYGLRELERTERPGIVALKAVSGVTVLSAAAVAFRLAPRLNAGGRLADAGRSVELLTTDDRGRAESLAAGLDGENQARQEIERRILAEALAMVEAGGGMKGRKSLVLSSPHWHPGVIGIVSSRLVERYYRPTILIAVDAASGLGRGSGRSIRGFNLYAAIEKCAGRLKTFGGHPMAAGLSICADHVEAFAEQFEAVAGATLDTEALVQERQVDAEIGFAAVTENLVSDLDQMEPCGAGNREPVFWTRNTRVVNMRCVGKSHLKLQLEHEGVTIPAIGFGMADVPVARGQSCDVVYNVMKNEWRGATTIELRLRDLRAGG